MGIRKDIIAAVAAFRPLEENGRFGNTLSAEEKATVAELMKSPTFCALIDKTYNRHKVRNWITENTATPAGLAFRVASKLALLVEKTEKVEGRPLTEALAASLSQQHGGQDLANVHPELAGMKSPGGAADKGCTQNQPVQGDKSDVAGGGVESEPLTGAKAPSAPAAPKAAPVAAPAAAPKAAAKPEAPEAPEAGEKEEKEEDEPKKKVSEGMNDSVEDKFGGMPGGAPATAPSQPGTLAGGLPQGEPKRDQVQGQNEDVVVPGEKKDKEALKADAEQPKDGIVAVKAPTPLDAGPANPALESAKKSTLETLDESGITISERLALALTEDASKKFDIKEGTDAWIRLFKAALKRVRQYDQ
jgi:hypothetical protein